MSGRFATATTVPVERTRSQIEELLRRYNCDEFAYSSMPGMAMIGFCLMSSDKVRLRIAMKLKLPAMKDFERRKFKGGGGRMNTPQEQAEAWEQACRSLWRAMMLVIKAKLEAVTVGISTIEREFLADIMLSDGSTVGESVLAQLPSHSKGPLLLTGRTES